jgi:hypothetical protein
VSAYRVWLNNGNPLSDACQVPIDCQDSDTWRADKPLLRRRQGLRPEPGKQLAAAGNGMLRGIAATSQSVPPVSISRRSSLLYEPGQIRGLGRTSSSRHYPMGIGGGC